MQARHIMTTPAVSVRSETTLAEVAAVLAHKGFSAVPVVDADGHLIGLVSEADLVRERFGLHPVGRADTGQRSTAGEVMTWPVEFVRPSTTVSALAKCLITGRRRSVPVVDGVRVVGMVTRRDVVRQLARSDDQLLTEVRRRLDQAGLSARWLVRVESGVVHLRGEGHGPHESEVMPLVEAVPGVIRVTVSGPVATGPAVAQARS